MSTLQIREMQSADLSKVKTFTDQQIGTDYYQMTELEDILERSQKNGLNCSFLLVNQDFIAGVRLTFPPGQWHQGKGQGLSPHLWPYPLEQTAYFQSLFIDSKYQGQGWGRRLSQKSIENLIQLGSKGVLCHSWKESPDNSSSHYLRAIGFTLIQEHPKYWNQVAYQCTRCSGTCECTAQEMYLKFNST